MTESAIDNSSLTSTVIKTKRLMAFGAAWLICSRIIVRSLALISTVIIARILTPDDFGIIAIAMTILMFTDTMSSFGFDVALIADNKSNDDHYCTAWSLSVIRAFICAIVLYLSAVPFADYYDDERLINVLYALSIYILLRGFENIGIVDFRKKLEFHKEFSFNIYTKFSSFIIVITAVYILHDYRGLIIGTLGQGVIRLILSYKMSSFRPAWSLSKWREIMNFSKWILINNFLRFFNERSAIFIVGKTHGVQAAGLLSLADQISNLATTELMWPIQRAVFPGYAKMSEDNSQMRISYQEVLNIVVTVGFPLGIGLSSCADQLVFLFLGAQWIEITPLISLLAVSGSFSLLTANSGLVFLATNRVYYVTIIALLVLLIKLPCIILAAFFGTLSDVCTVYILCSLIMIIINWHFICKCLNLKIKLIIKQVSRPMISGLIMFILLEWLQWQFVDSGLFLINALQLFYLVVFGCFIYTFSLFLLWFISGRPDAAEKLVVEIVQRKIKLLANMP